ncbi:MAG: glycosyltransferase family A protein [Tepidisphaeraceae bacterium]|jgi:hypothetical protein
MLSVIINFFNMRREARNSLFSLSRGYQKNIDNLEYEVIAVDNGSSQPLSEAEVSAWGPQFKYRFFATQSPSPVQAINEACRHAQGDRLMVMLDGAHILSPGILSLTDRAFALFASPFVATVAMHLGPNVQNISVAEGYNQDVEDRLLEQSQWRSNGYRLFTIADAFPDDSYGWFGCLLESNCFAMGKQAFFDLGGFDQRFQSPGGGLVNLDFFANAVSREELSYVVLLGEASFHQVHGGIATNAPVHEHPFGKFRDEFVRIRGRELRRVLRRPFFLGKVSHEAERATLMSAASGLEFWQKQGREAD